MMFVILVLLVICSLASALISTLVMDLNLLAYSLLLNICTIVYAMKYAPDIDYMGYEH